MSKQKTVGVRLLDLPYHLDGIYTYYVPENFGDGLSRGTLVIVPFGAGNRKQCALVEALGETDDAEALKPIISIISAELSLDEEMLGIVDFLRERTFCTTGDAVRRLIPAEAFERADEYYVATPGYDPSGLNQKSRIVFDFIRSRKGGVCSKDLSRQYSDEVRPLILRLCKTGALAAELRISDASVGKTENIVSIAENATEALLSLPRTTEEHRAIFYRVSEAGTIPLSELENEGYSDARIRTLEKRGLLVIEKREKLRVPYADAVFAPSVQTLSAKQEQAKAEISALLDGAPHGALLYGVTGSGKTSVVLSLCEDVVAGGKTAIVLVPEIALTWQSVAMFSARFGDRLAVIHSALSAGERFDAYRRIKRGDVDIVLGTRSAVFSPLKNLALIVIDEEQEHTYKSDMSPKYSARDVARFRCGQTGALMLLCSATPSVETYFRAKKGVYSLIKLDSRYGEASLPSVTVADMRDEGAKGFRIFGRELSEALTENFRRGNQSMLFLNRRGYSNFLICRKCGEVILCPRCSVAMAFHTGKSGGGLVCHYCGYRKPVPEKCPSCESSHIGYMGFGTQALEEAVRALIPEARVLRMDADTTKGKFSRDEIVASFARGDADILLGTQMIAKGHNFPHVTLAAVVSADSTLYSDDFRAGERTFSLITQLVGRSGRSTEKGAAMIQTYSPDAEAITLGAQQDYDKFYESEIAMRRALTFPPFCDIASILMQSDEETKLRQFASSVANELSALASEFPDVPMTVFGPFEASVYKLKNKYRLKIIIKHKNNTRSRQLFARLLRSAEKRASGKIAVSIDINPTAI